MQLVYSALERMIFIEVSKNLLRSDLKIILLDHQNNYVASMLNKYCKYNFKKAIFFKL